tara:strand:+ start:184 stop:336 length:153 start_codon:yes stop_codon:yes gene_type:complete
MKNSKSSKEILGSLRETLNISVNKILFSLSFAGQILKLLRFIFRISFTRE